MTKLIIDAFSAGGLEVAWQGAWTVFSLGFAGGAEVVTAKSMGLR